MNEDTLKKLGTILDDTAERDAVHICVVPLIAGEDLWSNTEIGLAYGTKNVALRREKCYGNEPIGFVDPLLRHKEVKKGQKFYGWLYPGAVTGMRHHFHHPVLDGPTPVPANESEAWLRSFADKWNFDYDEMIVAAQESGLEEGGYITARGIDIHSRTELAPGDEKLFWSHIEKLTGKEFDEDHREKFIWSCTC